MIRNSGIALPRPAHVPGGAVGNTTLIQPPPSQARSTTMVRSSLGVGGRTAATPGPGTAWREPPVRPRPSFGHVTGHRVSSRTPASGVIMAIRQRPIATLPPTGRGVKP